MSIRQVVRALVVVFGVLLLQTTVIQNITIAGAHPDLLLLLPIAAGMAAGAEEGAVMGFVAGFAGDLFLPTPLGLWALVGCLAGTAVGVLTGSLVREVWWFRPLVALVTSAVAVLVYALIGAVLGQEQFLHADLAAIVTVVSVTNALLAVPAFRVMRWAFEEERVAGRRPSTPTSRW